MRELTVGETAIVSGGGWFSSAFRFVTGVVRAVTSIVNGVRQVASGNIGGGISSIISGGQSLIQLF